MAQVPGDTEPHKRKRIDAASDGGGGSPGHGGGGGGPTRPGGFAHAAPQPPHFGTSFGSPALNFLVPLSSLLWRIPNPLPLSLVRFVLLLAGGGPLASRLPPAFWLLGYIWPAESTVQREPPLVSAVLSAIEHVLSVSVPVDAVDSLWEETRHGKAWYRQRLLHAPPPAS